MMVLVAGADADLCRMLCDALGARGHDVRAFTSSSSAFAAWQESNAPLIVVDRELSNGDAVELCRLVRTAPGGDATTILAITDRGRPGDPAEVVDVGANDYLEKPFEAAALALRLTLAERQVAEITERKRVEEALRTQALYDSLTGLSNRALFLDRLQHAIVAARRGNEPLALFVMDLDRFKEVNDTLGHHAGDLLLQQVGSRLRRLLGGPDAGADGSQTSRGITDAGLLRASDTVARLGGDEFAVLLPGSHRNGAARAARAIVRALEQPFLVEGLSLEVGASIGIALYPDHGEDASLLIQRADVAMYLAKETGSGHAFYTSERDDNNSNRLALMGELRSAVEQRQLFLCYQPKITLQSRVVSGAEALIRWNHPDQGFVPPDVFIPAAERTGLMRVLGQFVLDVAVQQGSTWREEGLWINVAVNLSARNLHDPELVERVENALRLAKLPPSELELEITESAVMVDPDHACRVLTRLGELGVRIAIDDFGTGYTSIGYLKRLPVNQLKIDKSFSAHKTVDDNDAAIVRSIINLGHDLGLKVVAEGVEGQDVCDALVALGCDEAQGYFFSRPIPAPEFAEWLKHAAWTVRRTPTRVQRRVAG